MRKRKLRSVNIALLGGHSDVEGKYELGIDTIRLVNEEDVKEPPSGQLFATSHPNFPSDCLHTQKRQRARNGRTSPVNGRSRCPSIEYDVSH